MVKRKKEIIAVTVIAVTVVLCITGWSIVKFYWARSTLQDVYFMEYGDATTIYKYDVDRRKTVVAAVLEGGWYSDCKINRSEGYIIGEFWNFKEDTTVLLRYNLSDNTTEEITGKEAEIMEEQIEEWESKLPERSTLPEEVRKILSNTPISWSADGKIAAFYGDYQTKIYLYNADTETCEHVLTSFKWAQTFGPVLCLDASGRYIFYKDNINLLFGASNIKIMIYDTQTGERIKIHKRYYTQHPYGFVQEMN